MAINNIYREILLEDYIINQLRTGNSVTTTEVSDRLESIINDMDLTVPQFNAEDYYVLEEENSSVEKFKNTFTSIKQDITVLYKEMIELSRTSINLVERWKTESELLEKDLIDLENRIENLLILAQDTEGYFGILIDNLTDSSQVDQENSTAKHDIQAGIISLDPKSSNSSQRIFLNNLLKKDVLFKVRTTNNFVGRVDMNGTDIRNPFHQESKEWGTIIEMRQPVPVTCEYTVKLGDSNTELSRIFIKLHDSMESGTVYITPLYSTDNQNFRQLPTNTFTQDVKSEAIFQFQQIEAKWIKFIITKQGADPSSGDDSFYYQLGFKEISFYKEGFDISTNQIFISEPLWITGQDGNPSEFERIILETCERLETNTDIKYYVNLANTFTDIDTNFDADTATWIPITPINRVDKEYSSILEVSDIVDSIIGDTETVEISYNGIASDTDLINPADPFHLLSINSSTGNIQDDEVHVKNYASSPIVRYNFHNSNDRILNYQIKDTDYTGSGDSALTVNESNILLFRNIGEKGLDATDPSSQVRGIQKGWKFEDPYYTCIIEIQNAAGATIDFGDQIIIIDDKKYTNVVNNKVLTGKTNSNSGIHEIKVHKNNWIPVTQELDTISDIKAVDPLYPYNHKMLIEGYNYGSSFPSTSTKVYKGMDLFAESVMQQVSIFDLAFNVSSDNYSVFALDRDTPNSHTGDNESTRVFVIKIDEENPDFQNERFMLKFSLVNQRQKYLRLRADFSTEDEKITPSLYSYKIKLG